MSNVSVPNTPLLECSDVLRAFSKELTRLTPQMRSADTLQFFPSSVSTIALLETLLSFIIAIATPKVVELVKTVHDHRNKLGLYFEENQRK